MLSINITLLLLKMTQPMQTTQHITKDIINKLELNPYIEGMQLNIDFLENILSHASNDYYNTDKPLLTDNTFDILENIVRAKKPNSYIFNNIGAKVIKSDDAVKLPYYMGSLDKVKPNEKSLTKWIAKHNTNIVISDKLDGLSALLIISILNKNSKVPKLQMKLYKHGDGYEGQEITHLLDNINITNNNNNNADASAHPNTHTQLNTQLIINMINDEKNINKHVALRGEIIIKQSIYNDKYKTMYPKARSLVAGIVNTKHPEKSIIKDMDIIFYEFIYPNTMTFLQQFEMLSTLGFNTASYKLYNSVIESQLPKILLESKKHSNYELDGLVLDDSSKIFTRYTKGNPEYAVAFKMQLDEQVAITKVVNVEYNISKHGTLAPRIEYNPVVIKGDTHTFTTGFNLKYIIDNNIGIGTEIKIIKSGDVIPYIYEIIKPSLAPKMPDADIKWHWSSTRVDAIVDDINNNDDVRMQKIIAFFKVMRVDGVGEGVVKKFINAGYDKIKNILELTPVEISKINGFQLKSATNVYNSIQKVINIPQPLERIMNASGIFSMGLGEKKFKNMLNAIPNFLTKWQAHNITKKHFIDIDGINDKTADLIINGMDNFIIWLNIHSMIKAYQETEQEQEQTQEQEQEQTQAQVQTNINTVLLHKSSIIKTTKLSGMFAVFTGIRNEELEKKIINNGGAIGSAISGKTTIIIAKNPDENSSKINKAREAGIEIINITDFEKKYLV